MATRTDHRWRHHLVWIGAIVSVVSFVTYFTTFVRIPILRDTAWLNLAGVTFGLALSVWGFFNRRSRWAIPGLLLSIAAAAALFGHVYIFSAMLPNARLAIDVGERAPEIELPDQHGDLFHLDDVSGSYVVLVFYRGFW